MKTREELFIELDNTRRQLVKVTDELAALRHKCRGMDRLVSTVQFALSDAGGFASPTSTVERLRLALDACSNGEVVGVIRQGGKGKPSCDDGE